LLFWPRCPRESQLEQYVSQPGKHRRIARHIERCASCRTRVQEIRDGLEIVAHLKSAKEHELNPASRIRIRDICQQSRRDVTENAPKT
jgi:hypothetical protein